MADSKTKNSSSSGSGSGSADPAPAIDGGAFSSTSLHRIEPVVDDKDPSKPRDVDPANPTRTVPKKKANQAYLVHQRYLERQREERRRARIAKGMSAEEEEKEELRHQGGAGGEDSAAGAAAAACCENFVKALFYSLLLLAAAGVFVTGSPIWGYRGKWVRLRTYFPPQQRLFTPAELQLYAGRAPERPIYLAVMGDVYDVTTNPRIYGPGGSYNFFAGRDASRAYITGCFDNEEQLTHDLRGLSDEDMSHVLLWKKFFDEHADYYKVGRVSLPHIDPDSPIPPACDPSKQ
ncbi:hypothetical protein OC834_000200 [Tilletia horrida]|uniref:Cytochrome b5 heme-binding domain-containing protein n=1 Tax=Tilletia horrida TaxID=155126 RepID=A0AAN6GEG8_9BASI|nr:hypothetical protein OC842_001737 [Tilletia horrida]KAK0539042.1 hypothetical protein OC834_000200 [Tilletia horrida]